MTPESWRLISDGDIDADDIDRSWLTVYGDLRNPDWVPDELLPHEGCHICGAVYVELGAVTLSDPILIGVEHRPGFVKALMSDQHVTGVRLICFNGHVREFEPSPWARLLLLPAMLLVATSWWHQGGS